MTSLYELEDQLAALQAKVAAQRAAVKGSVVEDYVFAGWDGTVRLSDLFGDHDNLILIHNMGGNCGYCNMWADGINGQLKQLSSVSAVVMSNHDEIEQQKAISRKRGWQFKMVDAR